MTKNSLVEKVRILSDDFMLYGIFANFNFEYYHETCFKVNKKLQIS